MKKTFYCPWCGDEFEAEWQKGKNITCPLCERTFETFEDEGEIWLGSRLSSDSKPD